MHIQTTVLRRTALFSLFVLVLATVTESALGQLVITNDPPMYGPYNASFYVDGAGLKKTFVEHDTVVRPDLPWSLYGWVNATELPKGLTLIAGVGDPSDEYPRYLAVDNGKVILWDGNDNSLASSASLSPGKWHWIAATFDGSRFHLYSDGTEVGSGTLILGTTTPVLQMAPARMPWPGQTFTPEWQHFGGKLAGITLVRRAITVEEIKQLSQPSANFAGLEYEEGSKSWP
ncbi:MAG: LamG-like jellyroll fold domain-containing protein, partial [Terriglobales bacterium]